MTKFDTFILNMRKKVYLFYSLQEYFVNVGLDAKIDTSKRFAANGTVNGIGNILTLALQTQHRVILGTFEDQWGIYSTMSS